MRKGKKIRKVSRRQLADPKLGISYNDRLQQSKVEIRSGRFKIKEHGNGYATLMKPD